MNQRVGIEALSVAVPRRYLALEDLARARTVDPAKFTVGLGLREMAVAGPGEDTVTLAATAGERLLSAYGIELSRIGMLVVGTETGVDHSKAVASYVQGLLGLPKSMRTFDTQHACYGGTAALMAASDWIGSGHADGRAALVICSDIARYGIGTPGEPTQGGGAVAMLVSDRPELLALDRGVSGVYSTDIHDFWRPIGQREARVDGHYSIDCYLDAVAGAYRMWLERATRAGLVPANGLASDALARIAYHVPFCKMARKAHAQLRRVELEGQPGHPASVDEAASVVEERAAAASFEAQVAPSLLVPSRVGNTYTASLYFALASLLHADANALAGKRIGLFSYGSGCTSEFFSGVVGDHASAAIERAGIRDVLEQRQRIDVAQYERIMTMPPDTQPMNELRGPFAFRGFEDQRRRYRRLAAV